jgi:predicted nuclease of predicted toxin-antitoxin system
VKLLIDMNLSPLWVDFLGSAGIEAAHWASVGERDASDTDIMAYAAVEGYIVLTHDLDFAAILAGTNCARPSVVQFRAADLSPDTIGRHLIDALLRLETEMEQGALLTIEPGRARMRLLPLRQEYSAVE